jgi:AcrR family transcriptional regulator
MESAPLEQPSARPRGKAETRSRLLRAARHLFVARGYDGIGPPDIAESAGLAVGTFYLYFQDKRDAFLAFSEQAAQELMEHVRAASEGQPDFRERLRASLLAIVSYSESNPGVLRAAFADAAVLATAPPQGASLRERLAASLADSLRAGVQAGHLRDPLDADLVAFGMVGFIAQAFARSAERGVEPRVLVDAVTGFLAAGMAGEPRPDEGEER